MPGWSKVFYLSSGVYLVFNLLYLVWGTAEVQRWNEPNAEDIKVEEGAAKMDKKGECWSGVPGDVLGARRT